MLDTGEIEQEKVLRQLTWRPPTRLELVLHANKAGP